MLDGCPACGNKYKKLGNHWAENPEHRPDLTDRQCEIIVGLMMGDGCLDRCNVEPRLMVNMITPEYLHYIDDIFGCLGTGVSFGMTAKDAAAMNRESGFRPGAKEENYSDIYRWWSRTHPELNEFNWYSGESGKKVWPEDINLTPTVLKHWYAGDGYRRTSDKNGVISVAMSNEAKNTEKVTKYFENAGLPLPSNYTNSERNNGKTKCDASFTVEDSKELWEYMGDPLPGFEYKWPNKIKT